MNRILARSWDVITLAFIVGVGALSCRPTPEPRAADAAQYATMDAYRRDTAAALAGSSARASDEGDRSVLAVAVSNAWLLVTDPSGARTGLDPASGEEIREIADAVVVVDQIDNIVPGEAGTPPIVNVSIDHPRDGAYGVLIVGQGQPSELTVHAFSTDGTLQPTVRVPLNLRRGMRTEFRLHFSSAPGSRPRLEKMQPGGPE